MNIEIYEKASDMPESLFPKFYQAQVECWGMKPFGEFMRCSNANCGKMYSLEDVFGSLEEYRKEKEKVHECTACGEVTEIFYEKESFTHLIREYFGDTRREVGLILLQKQKEIIGFSVFTKTSFQNACDLEFSTRPKKYNFDFNFLQKAYEITQNTQIQILQHLYVTPEFQGTGKGKLLLEKTFESFSKEASLPVFQETRLESVYYALSRALGFQNIMYDPYGYVLQYQGDVNFFEKYQKLGKRKKEKFLFFKEESEQILKQFPEFSSNKFYLY